MAQESFTCFKSEFDNAASVLVHILDDLALEGLTTICSKNGMDSQEVLEILRIL